MRALSGERDFGDWSFDPGMALLRVLIDGLRRDSHNADVVAPMDFYLGMRLVSGTVRIDQLYTAAEIAAMIRGDANSVAIADLHEASPAIVAGLKQGDVITGVNGHVIKDASELRFRLATIALGQSAKISYKRNGENFETDIKAIAPPDSPARDTLKITGKNPLDGASLSNINPAVTVEFGLKNAPSKGVVVTGVTQGTLSARVVRVGDVIIAVNGNRVSTPEDVQNEMQHMTRQGWILKVISGGEERTLMVR